MKRLLVAIAAAAVMAAALGSPVPAEAEAKGNLAFETPFTYNWNPNHRVSVSASSSKRGDWVRLTIANARGTVSYQARGKVTRNRLRAKFGRFGRVDLRFREQRPRFGHEMDGCSYVRKSVRGALTGTIVFKGEGNLKKFRTRKYSRGAIRANHAYPRKACRFDVPTSNLDPGAITISGRSGHGNGSGKPKMSLYGWQSGYFTGDVLLVVERVEPGKKVDIRRVAILYEWIRGGRRPVISDDDLATATFSPGVPFRGSATFTRTGPAGGTWAGDLRVSFPGKTAVRLGSPDWRLNFVYSNR